MGDIELPQSIKENQNTVKFVSWWWNGFIALILACIVIAYTLTVYGAISVSLFEHGTWLILGGFSLFFPTGGFLLIIGIPMLIGILGSINQIEIQNDQSDRLVIREKKFGLFSQSTVINLKSQKLIKFEVGRFGIKMVWIIILGVHAIYLLNDGLHLITSPFLFGYGTENALVYIITGIVEIIMILLIIIPGEEHLEIHTDTEFHLLRFHILRNKEELINSINKILGVQYTRKNDNAAKSPKSIAFSSKSSQIAIKCFIYGSLFWIIALVSQIFDFFAGTPLRVSLYLIGWFAMLYGFKFLSSKKENTEIIGEPDDQGNNKIKIHIFGKTYQSHILYEKPDKKINIELTSPRPIPYILMIGIIITLFIIGWTFMAWIRFTWGVPSQIGWSILYLALNLGLIFVMCDILLGSGLRFSMNDIQFPDQIELLQVDNSSVIENFPIDQVKNIEKRRHLILIICISLILGCIFAFF